MKKLIMIIFFVISVFVKAQLFVGLRDTKYVYGGYLFECGMNTCLEHSVYSDKFAFQKVRLNIGYTHKWNNINMRIKTYMSTLWNGAYQDYGLQVGADYFMIDWWGISGTVNTHYDSGLRYETCYLIGTTFNVNEHISFLANYTTIPEYRKSEKRIRGGVAFKVGGLKVIPEISIPIKEQINTIRLLCSMEYVF